MCIRDRNVNGIFIAVGEEPNSKIANKLGVEINSNNYIITDKEYKTNIDGVFAAGDITGGVNQLVVSCGEGASAAVNAYDLSLIHISTPIE